jgi:cellulose synthase/poly-beta-1,6-N-acetylglucosamine synthase-like glycosyltransferase
VTWADLLEGARTAVTWLIDIVSAPVLVYFVVINTSYLALIALAALEFRAQLRRRDAAVEGLGGALTPGVSLVVPAYNEEAGIVTSVKALLSLRYPQHEVVVVDDGSTDATFERLSGAFDLVELPREVPADIDVAATVRGVFVPRDGRTRLMVVRKENSGRSEAVNLGINAATEPLVAMIDADSILEPDALLRVTKPFSDDPIRVVAAGGTIRPANGSRVVSGRIVGVRMPGAWLPRIQVVEYLRAFLIGRAGWSRAGGLLIISGAFGIFRKDVLLEVDGLSTDCIGEDAELVVRIHKLLGDRGRDADVVFVPEPVAWTEVPEERAVLRKQRRRWHRGLTEIFVRHGAMMFRRRYGVIGMLTMPWFLLFELLAPIFEVFGLAYFAVLMVGLGLEHTFLPEWDVVNVPIVVLLLTASILFAIFVTLAALLAEEISFRRYRGLPDLFRAMRAAVLENFGYRQINAWWRLGGIIEVLRRSRHDWGDMQRKGFGTPDS